MFNKLVFQELFLQGNRLNKLLTNCDFSESTVVNVADFGDFTWPIRQKSPSHPNF